MPIIPSSPVLNLSGAAAQGGILASQQLTATTATAVYTVGTNSGATVATMALTNTSGSAVTVTVNVVPSGGSAGATNTVLNAYSLGANDTISHADVLSFMAGLDLGPGDVVSVTAGTANVVNVVLTGLQYA